MAQKKFSRLSIMLEARDGMSKQFNNAAKASQNLQKSVQQLDSSLARSSKGTEQVSKSTKEATTSMGSFAKSLATAAKQSAAAYVAGKVLNSILNVTKNVTINTALAFKDLGLKILTATQNTKLFQSVAKNIRTLQTDVKLVGAWFGILGDKIKSAAVNSKTFQSVAKTYRTVSTDIKLASMMMGDFSKKIADSVRNSRAVKAIEATILGVKKQVVATSLAFTLWKNSSVFVQKLKNDFSQLKTAASYGLGYIKLAITDLMPKFLGLKKNIQNVDQSLQKVGQRRATFNQLADANARLNSQLTKMNQELNRSNNSLSKMGGHIRSLNVLGHGVVGYQAAKGLTDRGTGVAKDALQNSMQQNYDRESMKIVVGKDKGDAFYDTVQNYAASTVYSPEEWAGSLRGIIRKAQNTDQLKKYMLTIEQLATIDPDQGLAGAAYAMRELASGNTKSLVNRFELQKGPLEVLKKVTDPMKQAEMLSKILGDQTGFSAEGITDMKKLPLMEFKSASNKVKRGVGQMGTGIISNMEPALKNFNKMFDEGKFNGFIQKVSAGLGKAASAVLSFGTNLFTLFQSGEIQRRAQPFIDVFTNIVNTLQQAWPNIQSTIQSVWDILGKVAGDINKIWPEVNDNFQKFSDLVKNVAKYIDDHYTGIRDVVLAVGSAFLTYKALMFVEPLIMGIVTAIKLYRSGALLATAAQWALNIAMDANPIGIVIIALSAIVGALVYYAFHMDEINKKVKDTWTAMKGWGYVILEMLGPIGQLAASAIFLIDNWGAVRKAGSLLWQEMQVIFSKGVNASIGYLNKLIDAMNLIPGVHMKRYNLIPEPVYNNGDSVLNDPSQDPTMKHSHRGGLGYVPYDGYNATLHRGEKVLTAQQNKESNGGLNGVSVTGNTFVVRQDSDIDSIAQALYNKLYETKTAMG